MRMRYYVKNEQFFDVVHILHIQQSVMEAEIV